MEREIKMKTLVSVLCILSLATVAMATPIVTFTTDVGLAVPDGFGGYVMGNEQTTFQPGDVVAFEVFAAVSGNALPAVTGTYKLVTGHQGGVQRVCFNITPSVSGVVGSPNFGGLLVGGLTDPGTTTAAGGVTAFGSAASVFAGLSDIQGATTAKKGNLNTFLNGVSDPAAFGEDTNLIVFGTFVAGAGGTTTISLSQVATSPTKVYNVTGTPASAIAYLVATSDFDDASQTITVTPEPMTLSLLALGAIGLIRRKRA